GHVLEPRLNGIRCLPKPVRNTSASAIDGDKTSEHRGSSGFDTRDRNGRNITELRDHGFGLAEKDGALLLAIEKIDDGRDIQCVIFFDRIDVGGPGRNERRLVSTRGDVGFGRKFYDESELGLRILLPGRACRGRRDQRRCDHEADPTHGSPPSVPNSGTVAWGEKQGQTLPAKRELILIVDVTLRERGLTPFFPPRNRPRIRRLMV